MHIEQFPIFHQAQAKWYNTCVPICVGMVLHHYTFPQETNAEKHLNFMNEVAIQTALDEELMLENGMGSKGAVALAKKLGFNNVEFGWLGNHNEAGKNQGIPLLHKYLEQKIPVIVMTRVHLSTDQDVIAHAMVVTGIDKENNITIVDPYSNLTRNTTKDTMKWQNGTGGAFQVTWDEFDASWNTYDTDEEVLNYRFYMCIHPK
jgi:hypothetical protein